jgi:hypothetical protein
VSRYCHEPRVAVAVIDAMLAPARSRGLLRVLMRRKPVAADATGDGVRAVTFQHLETGRTETIRAKYVLDATELGDLLPLAGVEYVSGAESQAETGEPHAPTGPARPDNVQGLTWCFPVAFDPAPGAAHVIDKPRQYERWRDFVPNVTPGWTGRLLSWTYPSPVSLKPVERVMFPEDSPAEPWRGLWPYRKIVTRDHYAGDDAPHEVSLINWPQNDYFEGNIIDAGPDLVARYLDEAKQLSLSFLYWLQTEAGRPDGKQGYPGLYLVPELVGTDDGLAKAPYVRESRRIRAMFTVTENHIGTAARDKRPPEAFPDSVGVGCYRIDLHPSTGGDNYIDVSAFPFQIPLGSLVPRRVENLLAACKNVGVTHITNGCYRLHPVEWNIGESAGLLAAFCLRRGTRPRAVVEGEATLKEFQAMLVDQGIELAWPQLTPV